MEKTWQSQKQIDNDIQEELKKLRKDNSELLQQNRELVEALTNSEKVISSLKMLIVGYPSEAEVSDYLHTASVYQNVIKELLTKHQKDV